MHYWSNCSKFSQGTCNLVFFKKPFPNVITVDKSSPPLKNTNNYFKIYTKLH